MRTHCFLTCPRRGVLAWRARPLRTSQRIEFNRENQYIRLLARTINVTRCGIGLGADTSERVLDLLGVLGWTGSGVKEFKVPWRWGIFIPLRSVSQECKLMDMDVKPFLFPCRVSAVITSGNPMYLAAIEDLLTDESLLGVVCCHPDTISRINRRGYLCHTYDPTKCVSSPPQAPIKSPNSSEKGKCCQCKLSSIKRHGDDCWTPQVCILSF